MTKFGCRTILYYDLMCIYFILNHLLYIKYAIFILAQVEDVFGMCTFF
jgi:hypothetical protein